MALTIDTRTLLDLDRKLAAVGKSFSGPAIKQVLRVAAKPALTALRANAPVRKGPVSAKRKRTETTRGSARILTVDGRGEEIAAVLVGISKKRGRAGYKAPWQTRGTTTRMTRKGYNRGRMSANDYLDRTERQVGDIIVGDVVDAVEAIVKKTLNV